MHEKFGYLQNTKISNVSYLQRDKKKVGKDQKYVQRGVQVVCIHKHYYNLQGLGTRIHVRNFSMHEIAAYTTSTQIYFYVHKKTCTQSIKFSSPALFTIYVAFITEPISYYLGDYFSLSRIVLFFLQKSL